MSKLWNFEDYVNHLAHECATVRAWAFRALENRYPNQFVDQVSGLISDEDEYLVSRALNYLSLHQAVQHAPAILERFKNSQGMVSQNCASTLGKMHYEPAMDVMLDKLSTADSAEMLHGILDYLGHIPMDTCRETLKSAVTQIEDIFLRGPAIGNLVRHYHPEDITLVLNRCFDSDDLDKNDTMLLTNVLNPLGGASYFSDLTRFRTDSPSNLAEIVAGFISENSHIELDRTLHDALIQSLEKEQYSDFITAIGNDALSLTQARYPNNNFPDWLNELYGQDTMCMSLIEDLAGRSSIWRQFRPPQGWHLIALLMSAYAAIKERNTYVKALHPEADTGELIQALINAGPTLPAQIRKRIKELAPISELKQCLTETLTTQGDIWAVKIMGEIGHKDFVSDLIDVLNKADYLDYIHGDARKAMCALDESADERILTAIENKEVGNWERFAILDHLPYSEAFDQALRLWEGEDEDSEESMSSYELFAYCLTGIGDKRGIKTLQSIYANENNAGYIGDSLECLSKIHGLSIPEMPAIIEDRKTQEEQKNTRLHRLTELVERGQKKRAQALPETKPKAIPITDNAPKVGRNEPCPCGSGKKFKKCCLNKHQGSL